MLLPGNPFEPASFCSAPGTFSFKPVTLFVDSGFLFVNPPGPQKAYFQHPAARESGLVNETEARWDVIGMTYASWVHLVEFVRTVQSERNSLGVCQIFCFYTVMGCSHRFVRKNMSEQTDTLSLDVYYMNMCRHRFVSTTPITPHLLTPAPAL